MSKRIPLLLLALGCLSGCRPQPDTLARAWKVFETPQDSCRTKVWWFHGETVTTREGITADLEAFREAGVGGVVYYDQVHGNGEGAFEAFSPAWWDMLKFSAEEAGRLGLSFEINLSNGYVAGGPWITKPLSMQRILAADTVVAGGGRLHCRLSRATTEESYPVAVLAYPVRRADYLTHRDVAVRLSSSSPDLDVQALCFGSGRQKLRGDPAVPVDVYFTFDSDFTARSLTYRLKPRGKSRGGAMNEPGLPDTVFVSPSFVEYPPLGQLQWSPDGKVWHDLCDIDPIYQAGGGSWDQKTRGFDAVTARRFRLHLHDWDPASGAASIAEIGAVVLSGQSRTDKWEEKAGLYAEYVLPSPAPAGPVALDPARMVDLTSYVKDDVLDWDAPEGDWLLLYFTHESTRTRTKHGRANLMGLECDKLSAEAVTLQWNSYVQPILDTLTAIGHRPAGVTMDSHEAGSQNWTGDYEAAFAERNGFALRPWLPVLAGYVVGSQSVTDSLLKVCRRTVSDLVCARYFGTLQQLAGRERVTLTAQAMGNGHSMAVDNLKVKGQVGKPQGEFWAKHAHGSYDIKEASSAAHLYGRTIASAEAFTDMNYGQTLAGMKRLADFAYANGLNEFVVCASAYQPWMDRRPGNTASGRQYCLNRNNTYWPFSRPFWDYQARCAALMRCGTPVTDVLVYLGDDVPVKLQTYRLPALPKGYSFDVCTDDALLQCDPVKLGYRVLVIARGSALSPAVQDKIRSLRESGMEIIQAPQNPLETVQIHAVAPDLVAPRDAHSRECGLYFAHRRLADADVYFVVNHSPETYRDTLSFRSDYEVLQVWDPVSGKRYSHAGSAFTLAPWQACFIVCSDRQPKSLPAWADDDSRPAAAAEVRVYPLRLTVPEIAVDTLIDGPFDWTCAADPALRYFSGSAVYTADIDGSRLLDARRRLLSSDGKEARCLLTLTDVHDIVQVRLNGETVTTLWCEPFRADLTSRLRPGRNILELTVTNSLVNRMVGDADLPEPQRQTYATTALYKATDDLHASGLLGDVTVSVGR